MSTFAGLEEESVLDSDWNIEGSKILLEPRLDKALLELPRLFEEDGNLGSSSLPTTGAAKCSKWFIFLLGVCLIAD